MDGKNIADVLSFGQNYNSMYVGFSRNDFENHKGSKGCKFYPLVMFLAERMSVSGNIRFTLQELMDCQNLRAAVSCNDFREIIKSEIIDKGLAKTEQDILAVGVKETYSMQILSCKLFKPDEKFVMLTFGEYQTVLNYEEKAVNGHKVKNGSLIAVYLYIKQYFPSKLYKDNYMQNSQLLDKPRLSYPSHYDMVKNLGLSRDTITRAVAELEDMKLLYICKDLYIKDKKESGGYRPCRWVYALEEKHLNKRHMTAALSKMYKQPVYIKNDVSGKINYYYYGKKYDPEKSDNQNEKDSTYANDEHCNDNPFA